eukprot:m.192912 g.192912  ORF g.192912 m.192912 type:complete len:123 (+) comp10063_c0_seq2:174-542(+)
MASGSQHDLPRAAGSPDEVASSTLKTLWDNARTRAVMANRECLLRSRSRCLISADRAFCDVAFSRERRGITVAHPVIDVFLQEMTSRFDPAVNRKYLYIIPAQMVRLSCWLMQECAWQRRRR